MPRPQNTYCANRNRHRTCGQLERCDTNPRVNLISDRLNRINFHLTHESQTGQPGTGNATKHPHTHTHIEDCFCVRSFYSYFCVHAGPFALWKSCASLFKWLHSSVALNTHKIIEINMENWIYILQDSGSLWKPNWQPSNGVNNLIYAHLKQFVK